MRPPVCPCCGRKAELKEKAEIYGRGHGFVWACQECDTRVGVHRGSQKPLGTLADAETRAWRRKAHAAFDPLWRHSAEGWRKRRRMAYAWLAGELGIPERRCHIALFDAEMCRKVVEVCSTAPGEFPLSRTGVKIKNPESGEKGDADGRAKGAWRHR